VRLLGSVLDNLAEDMRHGVQAFDVKLHLPIGRHGHVSVWLCRLVGQEPQECDLISF
jgi:hypothetical protein